MAQATLSCPFGAIHLEDRRGTAQDGRFRAHIRPSLSPLAFGHLPLTRGVGPRSPITGDAYLLDFAAFPARKI